jgi:hypothetical protein
MWAYPGSNCPDRPSPEELSAVEVETRVSRSWTLPLFCHLVMAPTPCEEASPALGSVPQVLFLPLLQFFLFTALMILCRVSGMAMAARGALISS